MVFALGALKNFANFDGKLNVLKFLFKKAFKQFKKAFTLENLLKRDSNTGIFL